MEFRSVIFRYHDRIKAVAMARGIRCYPGGGTIDGTRGDHILLAPPFIVEEADVAEIAGRLGEAVDAAIATTAPR